MRQRVFLAFEWGIFFPRGSDGLSLSHEPVAGPQRNHRSLVISLWVFEADCGQVGRRTAEQGVFMVVITNHISYARLDRSVRSVWVGCLDEISYEYYTSLISS